MAKLVRNITAQTRAPDLGPSRGIGSVLGAAGVSLVVGLAIAGGIFYWMTRQRAHEAEREAAVQAAIAAAEHQRQEGEERRKRSEIPGATSSSPPRASARPPKPPPSSASGPTAASAKP